MQLRDGALVGGSPGGLSSPAAAAFTQGAAAVLSRWTALRLAVEGEWGGTDSGAKAQRLLENVVAWFGRGQGELWRGGEGVVGGRGGKTQHMRRGRLCFDFFFSFNPLSHPATQTTTPTTWRTSWTRSCRATSAATCRTTRRARCV